MQNVLGFLVDPKFHVPWQWYCCQCALRHRAQKWRPNVRKRQYDVNYILYLQDFVWFGGSHSSRSVMWGMPRSCGCLDEKENLGWGGRGGTRVAILISVEVLHSLRRLQKSAERNLWLSTLQASSNGIFQNERADLGHKFLVTNNT